LITDQIERLKELRPQSLTDVQWQSWRTLTAEILRRADPSRDWSDEFQGVARQAIRQSDTDELYASEVEGFATQCEKLREKEKAYLESVIGILRLDSD
jgi:hypothetical protein